MKVAIIVPTLSVGGAERFAVSLANWLACNNVETHFINMSKKENNFDFDEKVTLYNKNYTTNNIKKYDVIKKLKLKTNYIVGTLTKIKPDVIFEMLYYPIPYIKKYKKINKNVIVIGSERNNPKKRKGKIIDKILCKYAPRFCDGYVFQTEKVRSMFSKSIQNKSIVIPNPVSITSYKEIDSVNEKEDVISNVGRLHYQKGQDTLIKAFALVHKKYPNVKLKIYGEGQKRKELEQLINELHLNESVILEGNVKNVPTEITKSKIFVFTSRYEGMPNALLEAMACGLPCISTDCDAGPSEIIKNGVNGYLVNVDDINQIAQKIELLLKDESIRNKFSKEAIKIREEYSFYNIFSKYYKYFKKLTEGDKNV